MIIWDPFIPMLGLSKLFSPFTANEPVVVILPDETKGSGDDVALSRIPLLKHDIDTESKDNGNVCEADGAQSSDEVSLSKFFLFFFFNVTYDLLSKCYKIY